MSHPEIWPQEHRPYRPEKNSMDGQRNGNGQPVHQMADRQSSFREVGNEAGGEMKQRPGLYVGLDHRSS
jgi:hypothetical protein